MGGAEDGSGQADQEEGADHGDITGQTVTLPACSDSDMYGHAVILSHSTGHVTPSSPAAYHEPYHTIKGIESCSATRIHFIEYIFLSLSLGLLTVGNKVFICLLCKQATKKS